jgi:NAD(P)-dependent dehydrogenase (short-subunit alcohol dehydrogenase family)
MNKLEGKIALNTGGNSGIGLATARQFVNEGVYVFITGRSEPKLNDAVKQVGRSVSPAAENPKVERNVRAFLKALNSGGGQPIETLSRRKTYEQN